MGPRSPRERLHRVITACGVINLAVFAWVTAISYGIAAHSPLGFAQPKEADLFDRLARAIDGVLPGGTAWLPSYLAGDVFSDTTWRILSYIGPMAVSAVCFTVLFRSFRRHADLVDPAVVNRLCRFGVAFAAVNILAYPMLAADLWLYVGWGRMVAGGLNPYYLDPALADLSGLPIAELGSRLTYGPIWALVSGAVASIAGGSALWSFLLMKFLLTGCWFGTLWLLLRVTREDPPLDRAVGVAIFAWIPFSTRTAIGDGHNDIAMLLPLVAWLYLVRYRRYMLTWLALATSILVKYVTLPLGALELLAAGLCRVRPRRYAAAMGAVALGGTTIFLLFFRDMGMFRGLLWVRDMTEFWTPAEAVADASLRLGWALPPRILTVLVAVAGLAFGVHYARTYAREREFADFAAATLVVLMTVLFSALGHIWPWFILWLVPVGALAWRSIVARLVIVLALLAPMLDVWWIRDGDWFTRQNSGIVFYVLVGAVAATTYWWWPASEDREEVRMEGEGLGVA